MAEVHTEGVQTGPNPIDVVEEPHVPDGEIRGEQAVRAVLRQYFSRESLTE